MITFEYYINHEFTIYTELKTNDRIVMCGWGLYSTLWSARRGVKRIIKLLDKEIKIINVGDL